MLPVATHRGWIPSTPWIKLEKLREHHLQHLETEHQSEGRLHFEYEQRKEEYEQDIAGSLYDRDDPPRGYGTSTMQLVPTENELANARLEERVWLDTLIKICEDVKDDVALYIDEWQASLGDVQGLYQLAQQAQGLAPFISGARARYPKVVSAEIAEQLTALGTTLATDALHAQRLSNWLDAVNTRPIYLTFPFYESQPGEELVVPEPWADVDLDVESEDV